MLPKLRYSLCATTLERAMPAAAMRCTFLFQFAKNMLAARWFVNKPVQWCG
jgi:hypothetical protein